MVSFQICKLIILTSQVEPTISWSAFLAKNTNKLGSIRVVFTISVSGLEIKYKIVHIKEIAWMRWCTPLLKVRKSQNNFFKSSIPPKKRSSADRYQWDYLEPYLGSSPRFDLVTLTFHENSNRGQENYWKFESPLRKVKRFLPFFSFHFQILHTKLGIFDFNHFLISCFVI